MRIKQKRGAGFLGIWLTLLISLFLFIIIYGYFDNFMRNDFRGILLSINASLGLSYYDGVVIPFWGSLPWLMFFSLLIFGLYMAGTHREGGGI